MKQIHAFCLAILVAGLFLPGLPYGGSADAAEKNPCADEIAKFCSNTKPGTRAMIDCLEMHESELSDACKAYEEKIGGPRAEMREEVRQEKMLRQSCPAEIDKFCKNAGYGPEGLAACLNQHLGELSAPCEKSIKAYKGEHRKME